METVYLAEIENFLLGAESLSVEWGGGWMDTWDRWDIWIGEVNVHGMCASATNKQ